MRIIRLFLLLHFMLIVQVLLAQNTNKASLQNYNEAQEEQQEEYTSIRQEQMDFYAQFNTETETEYDSINFNVLDYVKAEFTPRSFRPGNCQLTREVYGYHPHWLGADFYNNYDYSLLSTFSYFSYELNPYTGHYKTINSWKTSNSISQAQLAGCKVELCVTNFGGSRNARFLRNRKAWATLAVNLMELLDFRNADGINIDFEHIYRADKYNFTQFIHYLYDRFANERPGTRITISIPALNNYGVFDIQALANYVDFFVIMGYDYHYSNSKHAGAVAPKEGYLSQRSTIKNYLNTDVSPSKFVLAVPYYGREWRTMSSRVPSNTTAYIQAPTYAQIKDHYEQKYTVKWDEKTSTPYVVRGSNSNVRQCWFDDENSLDEKYDLALEYNLRGVGIWALGYDNGYYNLWGLLEEKFMKCAPNSGNLPNADNNTEQQKSIYLQMWEDFFK